jgi:epoxyqueuosine reductase
MLAAIDKVLRGAGLSYRVAPADLATQLEHRLSDLLEWGALSASLYETYSSSLEWSAPADLPVARSLVVIAGRAPLYSVVFHTGGRTLAAVIPPTYLSSPFRASCRRMLEEVLVPAGFGLERPTLPVKLLAVRTGLGEYGRNDLCYVPGMGSFARLEAFVTDADLIDGSQAVAPDRGVRAAHVRMSSCSTCSSCHWACPTGCIPSDTRLINAERCLTFLNENEGPWPDWLGQGSHNSLVGCMRCQEICPVNRPYLADPEVVAEFDDAETDVILQNLRQDVLPDAIRAKLATLDLDDYSTVLGRNLRALMDHAGTGKE